VLVEQSLSGHDRFNYFNQPNHVDELATEFGAELVEFYF
jgi:hypothetical protein